jgi:hypothetical protein
LTASPIDPAVAAFLSEYLASSEELEVLMRVVAAPERWWDARAVSRGSGMSIGSARAALDTLTARNLLDIRITDDVRYRFRPATAALEAAVGAVAAAYQREPAAVAQFVMRGARGRREFAEAFRGRRRTSD